MQDVDHEAMKTVQREFDEIAALIESDLTQSNRDFKKRMNLYTVVYTAATRSKLQHVDEHYAAHKELYILSQDILTGYMRKYNDVLLKPDSQSQEKVFFTVVKRWQNYKPMKHWIARTFAYLSRFYIEHQDKPSLETVALSIFYHQLFKHVVDVMRTTILSLVQKERDGDSIDRSAVQSGIELFSKMSFDPAIDVYQHEFLQPYVEATAKYYEKAALLWIATDSATDYLKKAEDKLAEERQRCKQYFNSAAEKQIIDCVARELLQVHQKALLNKPQSGFATLLRDMRSEHIRRFCTMFTIVPDGLPPLAQILRDHCIVEGTDVIKRYSLAADGKVDFKGYVSDLIAFQQKYMKLLSTDLCSLPVFQVAIKEGIESVVNRGVTMSVEGNTEVTISCGELLALFCDAVIKMSSDSTSEAETTFDNVVSLLTHVSDKDVFQSHARNQLRHRLLNNSTSKEREEPLITRLKEKMGAPYTSHYEGMLNDKENSQETKEKFKAFLEEHDVQAGFDFSCQLLTTGFWPTFTTGEANPPPQVQAMMMRFQDFYDKTTKHRVIRWSHSEGSAAVTAHFSQDKEFLMTPMQACVIVLFVEERSYDLEELQKSCAIEVDELKRILGSFIRPKILVRNGNTFTVNAGFTSQKRKIQVPLPQPRISAANTQQVAATVNDDRRGAIEACIVRIMKSRRQMQHQELMAEAVNQLKQRFAPDAKQIKGRIEELIEREFLERDGTSYKYLA